jgi:putative PIN family toxin of toxin-antitoxin system
MRIAVDTNIIISAGLFPDSGVGKALGHIAQKHNLILCQYTLEELEDVFDKKFINRKKYLNDFVKDLKYELIDIKITDYKKYPQVRDRDDILLLAAAIEADADIFMTGDKDFDEIKISKPKIIKPRDYIEEYMNKE